MRLRGSFYLRDNTLRYPRAPIPTTELNDNELLTMLGYLEHWALGARVLACGPAGSVGVDPWPLTRKNSLP